MNTPTLAELIAAALLTPYGGPEGTRLAIRIKRPDGTEEDLGGNCKQSVVRTINQVLTPALADARKALLAASAHLPASCNAAALVTASVRHIGEILETDTPSPAPAPTNHDAPARRCLEDRSHLHD